MIGFLSQFLQDNWKREEGQTMAEYGLILALVAVVCLVALGAIGLAVSGKLSAVSDAFK